MTEESKMLVDRCKLVAEAYTNQNAELLIGALAEDSVYENQHIIEPLKGKDAIAHYIRGKFETVKNAGVSITCSVKRVHSGPVWSAIGKPCVVINQGDQGLVALLELSDEGQIRRIDLCFAPGPANTVPFQDDIEEEKPSQKSKSEATPRGWISRTGIKKYFSEINPFTFFYCTISWFAFVYFMFFDGIVYTWWNWPIAIGTSAFQAGLWPIFLVIELVKHFV